MKTLLKKSLKYVFSILPLAAIIIAFTLEKPAEGFNSTSGVGPIISKPSATSLFSDKFADLPCGFVSRGKQKSEDPTFVTNNYVPVLQYPGGNFPGTNMKIPNRIYSKQRNDELEIQIDGNLVLYCLTCSPKKALWSSQTNGKDGKTLFFQADGDLVLRNSHGKVVWHSNIRSKCAGSDKAYFTLQDDGNLAMLFNENNNSTYYLGGTGSTNDQEKMVHPGKIQ